MAQKTVTLTTDDFTGKELRDEDRVTVPFSFDGSNYFVDTTREGAEKVHEMIQPLLDIAQSDSTRVSNRQVDPKRARQWAREQGMDVPSRGRLPLSIVEAYREALEKENK